MSIVARIKALADEKNLPISEVEKLSNLTNGAIRRWDNSKPSVEKLAAVATLFNVSTDYLLGRTDVPQWATNEDVLAIDEAFRRNQEMSYDGVVLTDDEREQVDAIIRTILWSRLKERKFKDMR